MDEEKKLYDLDTALEDEISVRRNEAVQNFKMDFSVDDIPDVQTDYEENSAATASVPEENTKETLSQEIPKKEKKDKKKSGGCFLKALYAFLIVGISGFLAAVLLLYVLDSMAINRQAKHVDVVVTQEHSTTKDIADMLVENELIDYAFCFRIYSRISGADGKWQVGSFVLSPDMGYEAIIETLQTMTPRETVKVTIPEGKTVEEIADILEENGACTAEDFFNAVLYGEYDFDFIKELPATKEDGEISERIYRLEGYLFPDTYEFYVGSSGETVVTRMLENFDKKLTPELRKQIAERGWTIDQAVIIASLVEGEAASKEDMEKVSKVLQNRMSNTNEYPKLQLCSTRDYVKALSPTLKEIVVNDTTKMAYNTYDRTGLPVGAINNPGLQAIEAALNPSTDKAMQTCYFFATDYNTGITYFSQTFAEHERICKRYKIGMYG